MSHQQKCDIRKNETSTKAQRVCAARLLNKVDRPQRSVSRAALDDSQDFAAAGNKQPLVGALGHLGINVTFLKRGKVDWRTHVEALPKGNEWCKRLERDEGTGAEDEDEMEVVAAVVAVEDEEAAAAAEVRKGGAGRDIGGESERKGRDDEYKRRE
jgi:hypothetical protein